MQRGFTEEIARIRPALGAHTREILEADLRLSGAEIARLRDAGAIA